MIRVLPLIFILFVSPFGFAQEDEMSKALQHATKLHAAYKNSFAHNAPGAKIDFREIERSGKPGVDLRVKYQIYVSGVPKNFEYDVADWLNYAERPKTEVIGASLDEDDRVICKAETPAQCKFAKSGRAPVNFEITNVDPGQSFRFALFSGPHKLIVVGAAVPVPIEVQDGACHIEAIRLTRRFEVALLEASGFAPSSTLTMDGVSYGERHTGTVKSDAQGKAELVLLPFVTGHTSGTSEITVIDGKCSPKIRFEWGTSSADGLQK